MGCRVKGMTVQEYRASYNYREEYFKRNPGLFGCIWFCSQCFKPLIGKKNVVVDHIRPLNKGGLNHVSNCTACCRSCNAKKSDKVDGRVVRGRVFKVFEQSLSNVNRGVGGALKLSAGLAAGAVSATARTSYKVGRVGVRTGFKSVFKIIGFALGIVTFPLRKGSILSRLMFLGIYVLIILYYLSKHTTLLNAWS